MAAADALVHDIASEHHSRRAINTDKSGSVVTTHSNVRSDAHETISHEQNFCAFPVGERLSLVHCDTKAATKNMSRHMIGTKNGG